MSVVKELSDREKEQEAIINNENIDEARFKKVYKVSNIKIYSSDKEYFEAIPRHIENSKALKEKSKSEKIRIKELIEKLKKDLAEAKKAAAKSAQQNQDNQQSKNILNQQKNNSLSPQHQAAAMKSSAKDIVSEHPAPLRDNTPKKDNNSNSKSGNTGKDSKPQNKPQQLNVTEKDPNQKAAPQNEANQPTTPDQNPAKVQIQQSETETNVQDLEKELNYYQHGIQFLADVDSEIDQNLVNFNNILNSATPRSYSVLVDFMIMPYGTAKQNEQPQNPNEEQESEKPQENKEQTNQNQDDNSDSNDSEGGSGGSGENNKDKDKDKNPLDKEDNSNLNENGIENTDNLNSDGQMAEANTENNSKARDRELIMQLRKSSVERPKPFNKDKQRELSSKQGFLGNFNKGQGSSR